MEWIYEASSQIQRAVHAQSSQKLGVINLTNFLLKDYNVVLTLDNSPAIRLQFFYNIRLFMNLLRHRTDGDGQALDQLTHIC